MKYEANAENYYELRQEIVAKNQNYLGVILRDDEERLDEKLKALVEECRLACGGTIPCDVPVISQPRLWRTKLYDFCKSLPKGADLHVHGTALMPMWKLIRFLSMRNDVLIDPETMILHLPKDNIPGCLPLGEALDEGLIDRSALEKQWTVLGARPDQDVWRYFEDLFAYHEAVDLDMKLLHDYYEEAFRDYIRNGIYHAEIHVLLSSDEETTFSIVRTVRDAYYTVRREHPELRTRLIGSGMKMFGYSLHETDAIFLNTVKAQKTIRDEFDPENVTDFVIGFDLINEEDTSRPLQEYAPMLMKRSEENPDFRYFLHCGESLNSRNDNLIDAYLLRAKRVGHGMNLYRYPDLLRLYALDEICLEVCPVSNQSLRYTRDLRLHPGAEYLKRGVSIALCSDDPVYMEHETLTDDFFSAITAWGLGVAEIKQLCINSIQFSALGRRIAVLSFATGILRGTHLYEASWPEA